MEDKVITNNKKNEIVWINTAKAICMLLVFVNHSEFYADGSFFNIRPFYKLFFVNLFFVVSGYLFFRKQLNSPVIDETRTDYLKGTGRKTLTNIVFRILIPTIIFGLIFFVPKIVIRGTGFDIPYLIKDVFLGNWSWFTSTLFISELLLVAMLFSRIKYLWFYLSISAIAWGLIIFISHESNFIWHWQSGVCALVPLSLGGAFYLVEEKLDRIFTKPWILVITFIFYCWAVYLSGWNLRWYVSDFHFTILGFIVTIIACLLMIYLCKLIPRIGWLDYIGKNSIIFYMLCGGYPNVMAIIFQKISENTTVNAVGASIVSIVLAYITTILINRYLPFLVDFRIIKRNKA